MHGAPLEVEGQSMEEDPEAAGSGFAGLVNGGSGGTGGTGGTGGSQGDLAMGMGKSIHFGQPELEC